MNANGTESIKLNSKVVAKVRRAKKKNLIPIGKFFETAALEKLQRERVQLKTNTQ